MFGAGCKNFVWSQLEIKIFLLQQLNMGKRKYYIY